MYLEYHSRNIVVSEVVLRSRRRLIYTTIEFKIIKSERDFDLVMYHIQSQLNIDEEFSLDFSWATKKSWNAELNKGGSSAKKFEGSTKVHYDLQMWEQPWWII